MFFVITLGTFNSIFLHLISLFNFTHGRYYLALEQAPRIFEFLHWRDERINSHLSCSWCLAGESFQLQVRRQERINPHCENYSLRMKIFLFSFFLSHQVLKYFQVFNKSVNISFCHLWKKKKKVKESQGNLG